MAAEEVFLDTAYPIALASDSDQHHAAAVAMAAALREKPARLITTRAVLLEIGNTLARPQFRAVGVQMLRSLENDSRMEIIPLDEGLYRRGFELFASRPDKTWSLTDCISFVVMKERDVTQALTSDQHFEQAGFTALLRQ